MFSRMKIHAVWIPVLGLVLFGIARPLSSQVKGKTISCGRSGILRRLGEACGLDADYAYIFTGTVLSSSDISDTEKRLQVAPHEMFRGVPASELTLVIEQDDCLPELRVGEEWLFYLQRDEKAHSLVLPYGSLSKPIAEAQQEISTLRRTMSDSGLILGYVSHYVGDDSDGGTSTTTEPVASQKVTAIRESDGAEYSAISDTDGNYEFEPLPIGSYTLSANTRPGLWAPDWRATIRPRSCHAYHFELRTDGRMSGHVRPADGKPLTDPWVDVVSEDGGRGDSAYVDDEGRFEARGLEPGRYVIGVGINAQPNTAEWRARVYYPGVRSKDEAIVVELGTAERRRGVDFKIPPPAGANK
jgi:hypothetical protein